MDSSVSPKDEIWFLRVYHHISTVLYLCYKERVCNGENSGPLRFRYITKVSLYLLFPISLSCCKNTGTAERVFVTRVVY